MNFVMPSICAIVSGLTQVTNIIRVMGADAQAVISARDFCVRIAAVNVWAATVSVVAKVM